MGQDATIIITVMCLIAFSTMVLAVVGLLAYNSAMKYKLRRMKYEAEKRQQQLPQTGFNPNARI